MPRPLSPSRRWFTLIELVGWDRDRFLRNLVRDWQ